MKETKLTHDVQLNIFIVPPEVKPDSRLHVIDH